MINRILIVEDQPIVCQWVMDMVAEVFPKALIETAETIQQAQKKLMQVPDLLMVDLSLPDGQGHELISLMKQRYALLYCVVITAYADDSHLFPALQAGADGYLLKDQDESELKQQLERIIEGKPPLAPAIADRLFEHFRSAQEVSVESELTPRERETLQLIAKGYSVKESARKMELSPHTVAGHIKQIYKKLQVTSRAQAAARAVKLGIE